MVNSKCDLFVLFNISNSYHIRVIDVRSYNKDSYHITSHQPSTPFAGVHPVLLALAKSHTIGIFRYLLLVENLGL